MCAERADEPGQSADQPIPFTGRVKNTIRCANDLCKLPLCQVTTTKRYLPLHAHPQSYTLDGTPMLDLLCPACATVRTVQVH